MREPIHQEYYKGFTIRILTDDSPLNPREDWDNLGKMVCFHRRYTLGDKHLIRHEDYRGWDEMKHECLEKELHAVVVLPLYLYDHGGITMRTGPFGDRWDSGCVGFIYATEEDILKWYGKKKMTEQLLKRATKALESEVKTYDMFLTGEVYGYEIKDEDGEDLDYKTYGSDSCWGYFGDYREKGGCLDEAKVVVDSFAKEALKEASGSGVRRALPDVE